MTGGDPAGRTPTYEIRIRGHLEDRRARSFEGLTAIRLADGTTLLTGPVADQAALHGLLIRIRDLGLELLSLRQIEPTKGREDEHVQPE